MQLLIIGSGFHQQRLTSCGENPEFFILASWDALLRKVAEKENICPSVVDPARPTHSWERLLLAAANKKPKVTASQAEAKLRQTVCTVIRAEQSTVSIPVPIEVKSGATGKLKSLNRFIEMCPDAKKAVRLYRGRFSDQNVEQEGVGFRLLNVPYYHAVKVADYLDYAETIK